MPKKKNPIIAALLSLVFGPLGYLYIGWRYSLMGCVMLIIILLMIMLVKFDPATLPRISPWIKYPLVIVFAWKGYTICSVRNALIEAGDERVKAMDSFPIAAMSDFLIGLAMAYAAAMGLFATVEMFLDGSVFTGLLILIIGTPALVWIVNLIFGYVSMGIDALFAKGAENIFRK